MYIGASPLAVLRMIESELPAMVLIYYIKGILQIACVLLTETPVLFLALITPFNSVFFESF